MVMRTLGHGNPPPGGTPPGVRHAPHMGNVYGIPRPRGGVGHVTRAMIASSGPIRPPLSRGHGHSFPLFPGGHTPPGYCTFSGHDIRAAYARIMKRG